MLLTTGDVAKRLGVDTETVRRWCDKGKLKATRVGEQYAIAEADFNKFQASYRPYKGAGRKSVRHLALRKAMERIKT